MAAVIALRRREPLRRWALATGVVSLFWAAWFLGSYFSTRHELLQEHSGDTRAVPALRW